MSFLGGGGPFENINRNFMNIFGAQSQSSQQQPVTSTFGPTGGGTTGTPLFQTTSAPQNVFNLGGTSSTGSGGLFGNQSSNSIYGGSQIGSSGGGLFGNSGQNSTITGSPFQTQQLNGTAVPFVALQSKDTIVSAGKTCNITVKFQTITLMKQYNENKSLEELRLEDYQMNRHRKGSQQSTGLVVSGVPAPPPAPPQPSFLTPSSPGIFSQQSGNLCNSSGLFSQQKPNNGLFGNTATTGCGNTSSAFGSHSSPFSQTQHTANNTVFNSGTGASNLFSTPPPPQQQQSIQPQQGFGLFSQQTAPATNLFATTSAFQGSTLTTKPLFSLGGSTFGTTTSAVTPAFGTTASTTTPSYFPPSFSTSAVGATPATSGSIFGTQNPAAPAPPTPPQSIFGSTFSAFSSTPPITSSTSTGIGLTGATLASGFFNPTANQQQRPVSTGGIFGTGGFGTAPTTAAPGRTFSFGKDAGSFNFQPPQIQQQQQQLQTIQNYSSTLTNSMTVSFGTTPYKDNKLFYNILPDSELRSSSSRHGKADVKLDHGYLQVSSKRSRQHGSGPSWPPININYTPAVRKLTYLASGNNHSSISKYKSKIFDGFEEEDLGVGVNILSPKTNVKILDCKVLEDALLKIPWQNPGSTSTKLAQRSREIWRERRRSAKAETLLNSNNNTPIAASSPLLRNRRVRFTLPSFPSDNGETIPSPIYYPGEEDGSGEGDTGLGESQGSNSPSVLKFKNSEEAGLSTSPLNNEPIVPGSVCGVVITREGYYVKPSLAELDKKVDAEGNCFVMELEIGRKNFGRIKYLCPVNIMNVDIDKLIHFRHKEVVVYPDDNKKPQLGHGLNVPAVIYLERVWPVDKATNELIRNPDHVKWSNYEQRLHRACNRMGAEFISYSGHDGVWSFRVSHF